jgi:RHS repeat-associated protein
MGRVRQLTNSAGAVTDTYEYDAFGNLLNKTGTTPNEMLYRGEQWDSDLGLYHLRARWYDAQSGRFMSRDPNAANIKIPATLHKYLYAQGDPVNGVDPTGRAELFENALLDETTPSALRTVVTVKRVIAGGLIFAAIDELLRYALYGEPPPPDISEREPGPRGPEPEPPPISGPL